MSVENKGVENVENKVENSGVEIPKVNSMEERAKAMGWRPQEEWEGEPEDWIDAKEYVGRKPLFDGMASLKRELKENQKALRALAAHHEKVREVEFKRALETLKAEKKAAFEAGDTDKIVEVDDQITDLKAQLKAEELAAKQPSNQVHPNFIAWVERNSWYAQDPVLRQKADEIGIGHAMSHPEKSADDVLEYVEREIKKTFRNPNKDRVSAVDTSSKGKQTQSQKDDFVLTEEEEGIMKTLVRSGVITKEQYIEDLKKVR